MLSLSSSFSRFSSLSPFLSFFFRLPLYYSPAVPHHCRRGYSFSLLPASLSLSLSLSLAPSLSHPSVRPSIPLRRALCRDAVSRFAGRAPAPRRRPPGTARPGTKDAAPFLRLRQGSPACAHALPPPAGAGPPGLHRRRRGRDSGEALSPRPRSAPEGRAALRGGRDVKAVIPSPSRSLPLFFVSMPGHSCAAAQPPISTPAHRC